MAVRRACALAATVLTGLSMSVLAGPVAVPAGVVIILVDDIGYGDIDVLSPSSLATPNMDLLYAESVRLTDFHTSPVCSPTRAALLTGRDPNATGVWMTFSGRDMMRADEQTMAEVFRANGYKTGVFGKWHLGEGYPYAPRYRGFDKSVIHGGGAISHVGDYWDNDYYSGVDRNGNPTAADVYFEDGNLVTADEFCTDYWFSRAEQFVGECVVSNLPFFCYIPLNAAHSPFNAPFGFKTGFDGLVENIDVNLGDFDTYLANLGIKDDTLLIFLSDNGTDGNRLGDFRGKKESLYEGGHRVPCFWRWRNGGIAGTPWDARDVDPLIRIKDFLPTLIDVFGLTKPPGGNPIHGRSMANQISGAVTTATQRVEIVDYQRLHAYLEKWFNAAVMEDEVDGSGNITHKWRLVRASATAPFELYDVLSDIGQATNVTASFPAVVTRLSTAYDTWWDGLPHDQLSFAPHYIGADAHPETTLFPESWGYWQQPAVIHQNSVYYNNVRGSRTHPIRITRDGRYRFELRRWPRASGGQINGIDPVRAGGAIIGAAEVRLSIGGYGVHSQEVLPGATSVVFELDLLQSDADLTTAFFNASGQIVAGSYFVYVSRPGDPLGPPLPSVDPGFFLSPGGEPGTALTGGPTFSVSTNGVVGSITIGSGSMYRAKDIPVNNPWLGALFNDGLIEWPRWGLNPVGNGAVQLQLDAMPADKSLFLFFVDADLSDRWTLTGNLGQFIPGYRYAGSVEDLEGVGPVQNLFGIEYNGLTGVLRDANGGNHSEPIAIFNVTGHTNVNLVTTATGAQFGFAVLDDELTWNTDRLIQWRWESFASADLDNASKEATHWGPNADLDGDQLPTFAEYATDSDPAVATLPSDLFSVDLGTTSTALRISFTRLQDDSTINVLPQGSESLVQGWDNPGDGWSEVASGSLGGGYESVTYVEDPPTTGAVKAVRLHIGTD